MPACTILGYIFIVSFELYFFSKIGSRKFLRLRIYTWHNKIWGINDGSRKYTVEMYMSVKKENLLTMQRYRGLILIHFVDVNFCPIFLIINSDFVPLVPLLFLLKSNKNEQSYYDFALSVPSRFRLLVSK